MFLKAKVVRKSGKPHTYWQLVKSVRTANGPRHRVVGYLGELHPSEKSGWVRLMGRTQPVQEPAFPLWDSDVTVDPVPQTVEVQVRGVSVERSRGFGDVYLGLALWKMLGLDDLLARLLPRQREDVPWSIVATILTLPGGEGLPGPHGRGNVHPLP